MSSPKSNPDLPANQLGDSSLNETGRWSTDQPDQISVGDSTNTHLDSKEKTEPLAVTEVDAAIRALTDSLSGRSDTEQGSETEPDLFQQHHALRQQIASIQRQLAAAVAARHEADKDVRLKAQQESRFRKEIAARRHEEEEARKRVEKETARRRYEDERKLATDQLARLHAEEEAHHRVQEEERLRVEVLDLRNEAAELAATLDAALEKRYAKEAVQRQEMERQREEAAAFQSAEIDRLRNEEELLRQGVEAATLQRAEVQAARDKLEVDLLELSKESDRIAASRAANQEQRALLVETEATIRDEEERLKVRSEELRQELETMAVRRAALEAARQKTEAENKKLTELETLAHEAEETWRQTYTERSRIESEMREKLENEQQLLEDVRARVKDQEQHLEEAARRRVEEHELRLRGIEDLRAQYEAEAQERTALEAQLVSEAEALRSSEADVGSRIEVAEANRAAAEKSLQRSTDLLQRTEAEARTRQLEDERSLAKLEEVKRNVALEAEGRAQQIERLKKEIEDLRADETEHRNKFEQELKRRSEVEVRLRQEKNRLKLAEEQRLNTELHIERLSVTDTYRENVSEWHDDPEVNLRRVAPKSTQRLTMAFRAEAREAERKREVDLTSATNGIGSDSSVEAPSVPVPSEGDDPFDSVVQHFDDPSPDIRSAAALALSELAPARPADLFTRALENAPPERKRRIGEAIAASGLAAAAIDNLDADSREDTYNALCLLFVMAKAGEVEPLVHAIESHADAEVRSAAIKLLNLSGQAENLKI